MLQIRCPVQFNYCMNSVTVTSVWAMNCLLWDICIVSSDKVSGSNIYIKLWKQTIDLQRRCLHVRYAFVRRNFKLLKLKLKYVRSECFKDSFFNFSFITCCGQIISILTSQFGRHHRLLVMPPRGAFD